MDKQGEWKSADCPVRIPQTYLARIGAWNLPVLTGVVEAPIMRPDGSILGSPGYDEETRLYFYSDDDWPPVPEQPTRADAEIALRELMAPFSEFPFVAPVDKAAALSAMLTALDRRGMDVAPIHGFTAPAYGTGKGLLIDAIVTTATSRPATDRPR